MYVLGQVYEINLNNETRGSIFSISGTEAIPNPKDGIVADRTKLDAT